MKKLKLLLGILMMIAVLAGVVELGSPYAPVVQPVMEIEEIWAIEDARQESGVPLVTALENQGMRLGYDARENTFYCTLGMGNEDAWPDIHLTAPGAKGVKLVFVDDYSYDWCADAIRDGYAYQVMAYTDTQFWYVDLVFTSLPIVILTADEAIPAHEDVPVDVSVSWQGEEPLATTGRDQPEQDAEKWIQGRIHARRRQGEGAGGRALPGHDGRHDADRLLDRSADDPRQAELGYL